MDRKRNRLIGWPDSGARSSADPAAPLFELVPRRAPPLGLLFRIEQDLDALERAERAGHRRWWARRELVSAAIGGALAAASLTALLVFATLGERRSALVLADASGMPVLSVEADHDILRLGPPTLRPDGTLELWLIPGGTASPVSLGLVAAKGDITLLPLRMSLAPGDVLALSEEPPHGSPGPGPSGPVIASVTIPRG